MKAPVDPARPRRRTSIAARRRWSTGLALVAAMAVMAGLIAYVGERVFCAVAPTMPVLGESCSSDPLRLALIMAGLVGGVALVALLIDRWSRR